MVKVNVISGFLGAGKTTLIKKLLTGSLRNEKVVLLENEYGEIGIDGGFMKDAGITVTELNAGCICCTMAEIEIGGSATVVDAGKCRMYMKNFGEFFLDQVKSASTVIFSRTQLLSADRVEKSRQLIAEVHPDARIITTPWDEMEPDFMLEVIENGKPIWFAPLEDDDDDDDDDDEHEHHHEHHHDHEGHEHHHHHHHHHHGEGEHDADEVFGNIGIETAQRYEQDEIRDILGKLGDEEEYGRVLRAKGILQNAAGEWFQFDYVPGEIDMRDGSADYTGRLCVIGADLNETALKELFHLG